MPAYTLSIEMFPQLINICSTLSVQIYRADLNSYMQFHHFNSFSLVDYDVVIIFSLPPFHITLISKKKCFSFIEEAEENCKKNMLLDDSSVSLSFPLLCSFNIPSQKMKRFHCCEPQKKPHTSQCDFNTIICFLSKLML